VLCFRWKNFIQGEGYHTGTAYFIRIGGCRRLSLCDVKESWNAELHPPTELIVSNASKYSETVVVTGGEPLMWI
jgi:organic radical activating enzyme